MDSAPDPQVLSAAVDSGTLRRSEQSIEDRTAAHDYAMPCKPHRRSERLCSLRQPCDPELELVFGMLHGSRKRVSTELWNFGIVSIAHFRYSNGSRPLLLAAWARHT